MGAWLDYVRAVTHYELLALLGLGLVAGFTAGLLIGCARVVPLSAPSVWDCNHCAGYGRDVDPATGRGVYCPQCVHLRPTEEREAGK